MSRPEVAPGGTMREAATVTVRAPVAAAYRTISEPPEERSTMAYALPSGSHRAGPKRGAV